MEKEKQCSNDTFCEQVNNFLGKELTEEQNIKIELEQAAKDFFVERLCECRRELREVISIIELFDDEITTLCEDKNTLALVNSMYYNKYKKIEHFYIFSQIEYASNTTAINEDYKTNIKSRSVYYLYNKKEELYGQKIKLEFKIKTFENELVEELGYKGNHHNI